MVSSFPSNDNLQTLLVNNPNLLDNNRPPLSAASTSSSLKRLYIVLCFGTAIFFPTALIGYHLFSLSTSQFVVIPSHLCGTAHNQNSCIGMIAKAIVGEELQRVEKLKDMDFLRIFLVKTLSHIANSKDVITNGFDSYSNDLKEKSALSICIKLMDLSIDGVMDSIIALETLSAHLSYVDAHTWLSVVLTNHVTCLDVLGESIKANIVAEVEDLITKARTSLAMLTAISPEKEALTWLSRKITAGQLPSWVKSSGRVNFLDSSSETVIPNVIVDMYGSGTYVTVQEAVESAPNMSHTRYVIYVKKGIYNGQVIIGKHKRNLMLVGDGMDLTIITGSLNAVDGTHTFDCGTLIVEGAGFMAQDMGFVNAAGPDKEQAVAVRVSAVKTVMNRCKMDAYQDTLYVHSKRQFYKDCVILGTIDFIFGDASVVIQSSKIIPRKPLPGQENMITAQSRCDLNQNTGISIQNCTIVPSLDLAAEINLVKTYLGRPWRNCSRTVFMETFIEDKLYYGEFANWGPGSNMSGRIDWQGYHVISNPLDAMNFTVGLFIQGDEWLNSTGVDYTLGLFNYTN
ncbi:hypothetical protein MKW94_016569 [Papaver nudicaule]|uniref:Pectinesterase n=1 Tax=Papaver nudicaule TaxID=74823 RepID=A0AA41RQ49_PAPNU|nr:hypothetical protein [Papaver nudicaule]